MFSPCCWFCTDKWRLFQKCYTLKWHWRRGGALHFTHFSEPNQQIVFRTCREDECVYVRLQRAWVCATRGTSGRNSERVWQTDGHSVELFPISLSLIPFWVLHPPPLSPLQSLTSSLFSLSSTPFPSSSSSVKPGLGSLLTVSPLIFSLSLPLFPSSATSLLTFCWQHQLENIKSYFFLSVILDPVDTAQRTLKRFGDLCGGQKGGNSKEKTDRYDQQTNLSQSCLENID